MKVDGNISFSDKSFRNEELMSRKNKKTIGRIFSLLLCKFRSSSNREERIRSSGERTSFVGDQRRNVKMKSENFPQFSFRQHVIDKSTQTMDKKNVRSRLKNNMADVSHNLKYMSDKKDDSSSIKSRPDSISKYENDIRIRTVDYHFDNESKFQKFPSVHNEGISIGRNVNQVLKPMQSKRESILSFFDTGSVDRNYTSNREDVISMTKHRLSSLNDSGLKSKIEEPKIKKYVVIKDDSQVSTRKNEERDYNGEMYIRKTNNEPERRSRNSVINLQTVKPDKSIPGWYCEKVGENIVKSKKFAAGSNEYEKNNMYEKVVDPIVQQLSQEKNSGRKRSFFSRQVTTEEKKKIAKIVGIILATAGIAAVIMLLLKYKRNNNQIATSEEMDISYDLDEDEVVDNYEDENTCVFEKYDRVKCKNANFKAFITSSEKLHENAKKICASQNFKKVTKRLKEPKCKETTMYYSPKENYCSNFDKCFENFE
ncbi:hypothetical protein PGB90_001363 [Kerria lacca]